MRLFFMFAIIALNSINCNGETKQKLKNLDEVPNEEISAKLQQTLETVEKMTNEEKLNARTELTYSANNFALNLYKNIVSTRESVLLSVFPMFQSISLIAWASTGDTKRTIQEVLKLPQNESQIFAGFAEIHRRFKEGPDTWYSANNFFINVQDAPVTSDLKNISERIYSVQISGASDVLPGMVSILPEGHYICRIKSQENIYPVTFTRGNGTKTEHQDYVRLTGKYRHGHLPKMKATFVEIPCEQNDNTRTDEPKVKSSKMNRMFILLPNSVNGLEELEDTIDRLSINKLFTDDIHNVDITVPQTSNVPYDQISMTEDDLTKIGLPNMFSETAEIFLTTQQTNMEELWDFGSFKIVKDPNVNIVPGLINEEISKVTVDRPFICVITTNDENPLILHMARITSL